MAKAAEEFKDVNVLFNCVGCVAAIPNMSNHVNESSASVLLFSYVHQGTIFDCDEKTFDLSYQLNVKSMFLVTKAFAPNVGSSNS